MGSRRIASTKRKYKERDSKLSSVPKVQIKDESSVIKAGEVSTPAVVPSNKKNEPEPAPQTAEETNRAESSTDEHLHSITPQSKHTDNDWTEVITQGQTFSPPHSLKDDNMVDEMSSTSSESFHQETLPLKHEVSTSSDELKLPAEIADLRALRKDIVDMDKELKRVLYELDTAEQLNQDLKEEDQHKLGIIRKNDEELQSMRKERAEAESELKRTVGELEAAERLNQELNSKNAALSDDVQVLDKVVRGLETEKSQLVEARDIVEARLDAALQRYHAGENEKRGYEDAIEGLRNTAEALEGDKVRLVQQLDDEKRRQKVETQKLEERVRVLESKNGDASQQLEDARSQNREGDGVKAQLTVAMQRNHKLEEDNRKIGDEIEKLKNTLRHSITEKQQIENERGRQKEELQGRVRVLEEEKDHLMKRLEDIQHVNQELKDQYKRIVGEHGEKEQQLRALKETHMKATNRLRAVRTDLEAAVARNDELQTKNRLQASELQAKENQVRSLEDSLTEMTKLQKQRQSESAERRIRMLEDQVRRQTSELKAVKNQTRSGSSHRAGPIKETQSGVIGLLDTLNTEIFQVSAFIADSLNYSGNSSVTSDHVKEAMERANQTMGKPMVLILRSQNEAEFDPLPIQIALQACMVSCCTRIMTSWYPGHWEYADFLAIIYSRMKGSGGSNCFEHRIQANCDS